MERMGWKGLLIGLVVLFVNTYQLSAQHEIEAPDDHRNHKVAVYAGFTRVSSAFYEHETNRLSTAKYVPTLGVDYWYKPAEQWEVGMMADMEFDEYLIRSEDQLLERNNVLIVALVGKYKPFHGLGLIVGPGYEWEFKNNPEEFWVLKAGVEFEVPLDDHWELVPVITYDYKERYSSWSTGLSLSKSF